MKKLFFLFAILATLFVSCNSGELLPSEIIIQDDMLSPATTQRIKKLNIPDGYQILIEKVDEVEKGELSKYAKRYYKRLQKDGIARTDAVLILYIENCEWLVSRMPENLRNYIDNKYPAEYFNAQIVRDGETLDACVESMLDVIRKSIYEYENLSVLRKNGISENIFALTDALFNPVLPSDSWVFRLVFYIPLSIVMWLFGMTGSLHGCMFILLLVAVLLRIIAVKTIPNPKLSYRRSLCDLMFLILMAYVVMLPMLSSYILALPRYEHIYLLRAFGYNADTIDTLQSFYANYSSLSSWLVIVLFIAVIFVKTIVSNVDYVVFGMIADSSAQRKIYEKNATDIAIEKGLNIAQFELTVIDEDNDYPYTTLVVNKFMNALGYNLPLAIMVGLMLNSYVLYIVAMICFTQTVGNIHSIILNYNYLKNKGVKMIF